MSILYSGERWEVRNAPVSEGRRAVISFVCEVSAGGVFRTVLLAQNERSQRKARRLLREQLLTLIECAQAAANALAEPGPELEPGRKAD